MKVAEVFSFFLCFSQVMFSDTVYPWCFFLWWKSLTGVAKKTKKSGDLAKPEGFLMEEGLVL